MCGARYSLAGGGAKRLLTTFNTVKHEKSTSTQCAINAKKLSKKLFTQNNSLFTKKCAFTLAEVLITLVVIGVVSALTLPTLLSKIDQK